MFRGRIFGGRDGINLGLRGAMPPAFEKKNPLVYMLAQNFYL